MRQVLLLSLLLLVYSCSKKSSGNCPVKCNQYGATAFFTGYDSTELDSVYLRTYTHDGLFTTLVSSQLYTNPQPILQSTSLNGMRPIGVSPTNDYEIFIPSTNQTFKLAMNDTTIADTFPCGYNRGCWVQFEGAHITGGNFGYYATGPSSWYIILKKS